MITDNEAFLVDRFRSLLKLGKDNGQLTAGTYVSLSMRSLRTSEDIEQAYTELIHFLQNHEYYDTIDRIEKGEALYDAEKDSDKRRRYKARLDELYAKLAELEARGAAA
ncbi:hypothetical protein [Paenibacillus agaridevorans]|uniref:hypothetical protein n=1 Tax=Paenibacillus agaridevorans TaxID=171404 RepID=UPI001BE3DC4F|nr:hypothetical protein [Paenibacillus agaridevorans]